MVREYPAWREDGEREGNRSGRCLGAERSSGLRWLMVRLEEWLRTASARMESALIVITLKYPSEDCIGHRNLINVRERV